LENDLTIKNGIIEWIRKNMKRENNELKIIDLGSNINKADKVKEL